jgi:hypothetical protein
VTAHPTTWTRGGFVTVVDQHAEANVVFRINPESLSRTLTARPAGRSSPVGERLTGPPAETVTMTIWLDAFDALAHGGDHPPGTIEAELSALEMLLYPAERQVRRALGSSAALPLNESFAAPLVLLVWGRNRIAPVRLSSYSVTEEAFDADLAPVRATVQVSLTVISYADVPPTHPATAEFLAYQRQKAGLAKGGTR